MDKDKKKPNEEVKHEVVEEAVQVVEEIIETKAEQHVYIGPTLPGGKLNQNAVFYGSLDQIKEHFCEEFEKHPQLGRLFVPVELLGEQKEKVSQPGNALYKHYRDIAEASYKEKEVE